jgi:NADH dehydrogenase
MGQAVARNVGHWLRGTALQPFRYRFKGELLSLGRNNAVVHIGGRVFNGFPGWVVWRSYYINAVMGWDNRVGIFTDWMFAYFTHRRENARLTFAPAIREEEEVERELVGSKR